MKGMKVREDVEELFNIVIEEVPGIKERILNPKKYQKRTKNQSSYDLDYYKKNREDILKKLKKRRLLLKEGGSSEMVRLKGINPENAVLNIKIQISEER